MSPSTPNRSRSSHPSFRLASPSKDDSVERRPNVKGVTSTSRGGTFNEHTSEMPSPWRLISNDDHLAQTTRGENTNRRRSNLPNSSFPKMEERRPPLSRAFDLSGMLDEEEEAEVAEAGEEQIQIQIQNQKEEEAMGRRKRKGGAKEVEGGYSDSEIEGNRKRTKRIQIPLPNKENIPKKWPASPPSHELNFRKASLNTSNSSSPSIIPKTKGSATESPNFDAQVRRFAKPSRPQRGNRAVSFGLTSHSRSRSSLQEIPLHLREGLSHPPTSILKKDDNLSTSLHSPTVFACRRCNAILGDSVANAYMRRDIGYVILPASTDAIVVDTVLRAVMESSRSDLGSTFETLFCRCGCMVGRRYKTTSRELDDVRGQSALAIEDIVAYNVGEPAYRAGLQVDFGDSNSFPPLKDDQRKNFVDSDSSFAGEVRDKLKRMEERWDRMEEAMLHFLEQHGKHNSTSFPLNAEKEWDNGKSSSPFARRHSPQELDFEDILGYEEENDEVNRERGFDLEDEDYKPSRKWKVDSLPRQPQEARASFNGRRKSAKDSEARYEDAATARRAFQIVDEPSWDSA